MMRNDESKQDELANRLDDVLPAGRSAVPPDDENLAVDAALRLAKAPYLTLSASKKAAIFAKARAAHQPSKIRQFTLVQRWVAAAACLILITLVIVFVIAPRVNAIRQASQQEQDVAVTVEPIDAQNEDGNGKFNGSPGDFGCEHPGNYCNSNGKNKNK